MSRIKPVILNTGLVFVSLVIFFLILEFATFSTLATYVPMKLNRHMGDVSALFQATKKGVVPKNYILLLGDSYGAGSGDWLYTVNYNKNPPFNSAHIIHQLTGKDVLNIASSGFGSIQANVFQPVRKIETINASPFINMAAPDEILVYFYEGNDIENNVRDFFRHSHTNIKLEERALPKTLETVIFPQQISLARKILHRPIAPIENWFHVFRGFLRIVKHETKLLIGSTTDPYINIGSANKLGLDHPWLGKKDINSIQLSTAMAGAPALQGAGPELEDWEIDDGARIFESSLQFLKSYFPSSKIKVVYIPSPASIYDFKTLDVAITIQVPDRPIRRFALKLLHQRSNQICMAIEQATQRVGANFIDTRPHLRTVTSKEIIHGSVDTGHFNQRGYEELAQAIVDLPNSRSCVVIGQKPNLKNF
jgi:hypothetical protein